MGSSSSQSRRSSALLDKGFAALERDYLTAARPLEPLPLEEPLEISSPEASPQHREQLYELQVRWMDGSSCVVKAPRDVSCQELVQLLHRQGLVPYGCPKLLWQEQLLEAHEILQQVGVQHGSELQVVLTRPSVCLTVDVTCLLGP